MSSRENGHVSVVTELLKHEVAIDAVEDLGHTALMVACISGEAEVVEILLKANANIELPRNDGKTAIDAAKATRNDSIVKMLEDEIVRRVKVKEAICVKEGRCAICNAEATAKCGRCKVAPYCGLDCQKAHFKQHKKLCKSKST